MKNKVKYLVAILFILVAILLNGANNVNATENELSVSKINLSETYGYTTATAEKITIKNIGTSTMQIKNVIVDSANFQIEKGAQATLNAGETDTSWKIKAKTGLNAGTYISNITVEDMNNNAYTVEVRLEVGKKQIYNIGIGFSGNWTYGETALEPNVYGTENLSKDEYAIEYAKANTENWSKTKPVAAGDYTIRLSITGSNYIQAAASSDFKILPTEKVVKIVSNSSNHQYDGKEYKDKGYKIYFDGKEITDGKLLYSDVVSNVIVKGSVTDVVDNAKGNNKIDRNAIKITNKNSYKNIEFEDGTIKILPITTPIVVTAESDMKPYDGTELRNEGFKYTDSILIAGDTLSATITGSQKYTGTSDNKVTNVKVMRGTKDITSNYTFGRHIDGTLKVYPNFEMLGINGDVNVEIGETITIEKIKELLNASNKTDYNIIYVSGTAGTFNSTTGFIAGNTTGQVEMKAITPEKDFNGDGICEYYEAETTFYINVLKRQEISINGLIDNQEFFYQGIEKKLEGKLTVQDDKVPIIELEVKYTGVGGTIYNDKKFPTEVGTYQVTYSIPNSNLYYKGSVTYTFYILQAPPEYIVPTDLISVKGKKLSDITLPEGFSWNEPETILEAGIHTFKATFTPTDAIHYKKATDIDITVIVKNKFVLTGVVTGGKGKINVSNTEIVEGNKAEVTFTPNEGYIIDKVLINGTEIEVTNNKLGLIMNENKNVEVSYKKSPDTITEKDEKETVNPRTGDNVMLYIVIASITTLGLAVLLITKKIIKK